VPRIPDALSHSVVFIYANKDKAEKGAKAGGAGFVVDFKSPKSGAVHRLLVTNLHVAQGADRVIRISTRGAGPALAPIEGHQWVAHPYDDIAVGPFPAQQPDWSVEGLDWEQWGVTQSRMMELNMGVGDECIMIGRFVAHDGVERNLPLARFGNIALMPGEPVKDGRNLMVEAYLVEMRSLSGFSGSPVFVYMGPGTYRGDGRMMPFYSETIGLMGIDTGHKLTSEPVRNEDGSKSGTTVRLNTGVAIVSPSWKIAEALAEAVPRPRRATARGRRSSPT